MKLSPYCISLKQSSSPVLFNTLTREVICIDRDLYDVLRNRAFHKIDEELERELFESSVLVPDDFDEEENLQALWEKETRPGDKLEVTYALTFRCNMKCSYCVQSDTKEENECASEGFVKWVCNLLETRKPDRFRLTFFGGEPLLKNDSITDIAVSIYEICRKAGVEFEFSITTNGTLIKPISVELWEPYGLKCLDVTIDGTRETHDRKRSYKNGSGTFDDIIDNLKSLKGLVPINLICNLPPTKESHVEFLNYLSDQKSEIEFGSIRFKPYFDNAAGGCFFSNCHIEAMEEIQKEAERLSLPVENDFILGPCGFFDNNSFAVSPVGDIYPCTPFFGNRDYVMGNVKTAGKLEKHHSIKDNLSSECSICSFCPVCFGGCRFVSLKVIGDVSKPSCEKEFFKSIFEKI
jgi:uncharacterized protein